MKLTTLLLVGLLFCFASCKPPSTEAPRHTHTNSTTKIAVQHFDAPSLNAVSVPLFLAADVSDSTGTSTDDPVPLGKATVWLTIILCALECFLRIAPTDHDYSIINFAVRILNMIVPNVANTEVSTGTHRFDIEKRPKRSLWKSIFN